MKRKIYYFSVLPLLLIFICVYLNNSFEFILNSNYNNAYLKIMHGNMLQTGISSNKIYNVKIAIIDSGYQKMNSLNMQLLNTEIVDNSSTHGLIVSSLIASKPTVDNYSGLIPKIKLYYYDIPNSQLNSKNLTNAILYVSKYHVDVINICLSTNEYSAEMENAIKYAIDNGSTIVASAGNDNSDIFEYPASFNIPGLISVGVVDSNLNIPTYATVNSSIKVYAEGENIFSLDPETHTIKEYSGTSLSTPFVTVAVALIKAKYPYVKPFEVEKIILNNTDTYLVNCGFENKVIHLINYYKLINNGKIGGDYN
jgi:subtilisin